MADRPDESADLEPAGALRATAYARSRLEVLGDRADVIRVIAESDGAESWLGWSAETDTWEPRDDPRLGPAGAVGGVLDRDSWLDPVIVRRALRQQPSSPPAIGF